MKKYITIISGILILAVSFFCITNQCSWGKQTSIVSGDKLQRINFAGKLIPFANQDQIIAIDNISIGNNIKQIPVYVTPTSIIPGVDPHLHIITTNPKDILEDVGLDLSETGTIETKRDAANNPIIWKYMEGDKEKRNYIELIVTSHDKTINNYLIESRILLRYNKNPKGLLKEAKLNFKGVLKLIIYEDYTDREFAKKKDIETKETIIIIEKEKKIDKKKVVPKKKKVKKPKKKKDKKKASPKKGNSR